MQVLSSPVPIKRRNEQVVSNIQLADMKGHKVRMSLWNEKAKQQEELAQFTVSLLLVSVFLIIRHIRYTFRESAFVSVAFD